MILTLTPNPTIDRVLSLREFAWGQPVRAEREVVTPSGKGVDASLVIHELGGETVALGLNAGVNGRLLAAMLDERGLRHDFTPAEGETRTATVLVNHAIGDQSTVSAPTLRATAACLDQLCAKLDRYTGQAWGLICGGSLPSGLPRDAYAHLLRHARERGLITLLDTSGQALCDGLAGRPHILKVNQHEWSALAPELALGDVWEKDHVGGWVSCLGKWATDALVITLGEEGALAVTRDGVYLARPPPVPVANTAGAGDALSAGLMLARSRGEDWPAALALGTAAAASVVMNDGTAICRRAEVDALLLQVRVSVVEYSG